MKSELIIKYFCKTLETDKRNKKGVEIYKC